MATSILTRTHTNCKARIHSGAHVPACVSMVTASAPCVRPVYYSARAYRGVWYDTGMKTDRLVAITLYLMNHETVSASKLAERFEVSRRTIQRDMDALSQAGVPVAAVYGVEGGYRLMDGFKLAKQIAGLDDYANIITALRGLCSAYDSPKVNDTLTKALSVMQGGDPRIFIDFSAAREGMAVNEYLRIIEQSIQHKTPLIIEYGDAGQNITTRQVEPLALTYQWYAWYMFAYCTMRKDYRFFKLPRISRCEIQPGAFSKEHGPVEPLMKSSSTPDHRNCWHIRLLCKKEIRLQAMEYLSSRCIEECENGDFILTMDVPFERMWFSLLMGFGNQVEVLEPDTLKDLLKEKAMEITALYGEAPHEG